MHVRIWMAALVLVAGGAVCGSLVAGAESTATTTAAAQTAPARELAKPTTLPGVGNFAKVSDALYRGEQPTAEGMRELKKLGVKTVVNLRDFHSDRDKLVGTGLQYAHIPCAAWNPEERDVVRFLKLVGDPANQPVFVHCWQGADRTGMMVLAYRVAEQGWTVEEALKELPNFGFHSTWKDLHKYMQGFDANRVREKMASVTAPKVNRVD